MKSVALHNLGCKVNSYELEVMQQMLQEKGYRIVAFDELADIYIVNTCTVTNIADRKSRQMLHRAKARNPHAVVVAVGCYVQTGQEKVEMDDCIDLAIGNNRKKDIAAILEAFLEERGLETSTIGDMAHDYAYEEMSLKQTSEHTRVYIKIQDGCNQFCTYCIIPYARGRVRSRRIEDICQEIRGLAAAGYKEVVLTGIHIGSYGIDLEDRAWTRGECLTLEGPGGKPVYTGSPKLVDLVEKIHEISGISRIRLGSLEPRIITRENAMRLAELGKVCPHFHLSLQSGCDATLKRMNRHYTTEEFRASVGYLREAFGDPAITTDVIVGFPGETEEEFEVTRSFLEETGFFDMHVFKFSPRQGTPAAAMKDQLTENCKARRSGVLLELAQRQTAEFGDRRIGCRTEVLFEEEVEIDGKTYWVGHTRDYLKVAVASHEPLANRLVTVQVEGRLKSDVLLAGC